MSIKKGQHFSMLPFVVSNFDGIAEYKAEIYFTSRPAILAISKIEALETFLPL